MFLNSNLLSDMEQTKLVERPSWRSTFSRKIPDGLSVMKNYLKGRRCPEAMEVFDGCLVQDRVRSVGVGVIH
ncbi:hypothetical protein PoB_001294000 [Plakobranchus ocellatus]|uniref:Uncharacterized protein n=1 Tax=Plakobranchus ocellatus TaxID=259542 RepID=A0AAV3YTC8_9GAST|nr:hypothetical protein PoB_001294000 [Plakobranchus ocellatus]